MTLLEKMQAVIEQHMKTPQGLLCVSFPCDNGKENECPMLYPIGKLCTMGGNEEFLLYATEYVEQHARKADNATDKKQTAQDKPASSLEETCARCDHKNYPEGGHCYMFRDAPREECLQAKSIKVECVVCEQDFDPSKEGGSINDVCFTCEARGK